MKITGNDISKCLERMDRFMDHCGLSPINNLVNCITKTCIRIYRKCYPNVDLTEKRKQSFLGHYFDYIDKKDGEMCVVGLVPLLGSVLIYDYNKTCENKKKLHKDMVLELPKIVPEIEETEGEDVSDLISGFSEDENSEDELLGAISGDYSIEVTAKTQKGNKEEFGVLHSSFSTTSSDSELDLDLDEVTEL